MKLRNKILTSTLFILGVSAIMLTGFSYAWINSNNNIAEINLHSGDADAKINGFYLSVKPIKMIILQFFLIMSRILRPLKRTQEMVNYHLRLMMIPELFSTLNALSLYHDENSISAQAMPGYYVEIQLFTLCWDFVYVRFLVLRQSSNSRRLFPLYLSLHLSD